MTFLTLVEMFLYGLFATSGGLLAVFAFLAVTSRVTGIPLFPKRRKEVG